MASINMYLSDVGEFKEIYMLSARIKKNHLIMGCYSINFQEGKN